MPVRIVLVDDHKLLRDGLRLRLGRETDLEVVGEAGTMAEAYSQIESTRPDLVVMDINLPGGSGFEVIAKVRASQPQTRLIVLTGTSDPAIARDVAVSGADGFLRKEDAIEELPRAIRAVCAGLTYLSPTAAAAMTQAVREPEPAANASTRATVAPNLSERERAVLQGIGEGITYKEIAARLSLSVKSVETYRARLARKLGCSTKVELAHHAVRLGLVRR